MTVLPASSGSSVNPELLPNVAVHERLVVNVTVPSAQSASPLQPRNSHPGSGAAVSITTVPLANCDPQMLPHSMAVGDDVTRPVPPPVTVTVSTGVVAAGTIR